MAAERRLRYVITRVCLSDGTMTLQRSLRSILPASGDVTLRDGGHEWPASVDSSAGVVRGLGEFYRRQGLRVNDEIFLELLPDGAVGVAAIRSSAPRPDHGALDERVKELVREWGQPIGVPELRSLWQAEGLPEVDFEAVLSADGAFEKRDGCWRAVNVPPAVARERAAPAAPRAEAELEQVVKVTHGHAQGGRAVGGAGGSSWPTGSEPRRSAGGGPPASQPARPAAPPAARQPTERSDLSTLQQVSRVFASLGFQVEPVSPREMLLAARLGKRSYQVLMHVLGPKVNWSQLLAERRNRKAQFLAVTGPNPELTRISASANLAKATLWPLESFARLTELAHLVPVGPLELEPHFADGGLIDGGQEKFEEAAGRLIDGRGLVSRVLVALADRPRGASVFVEELTGLIGEPALDAHALDRAIDTLASPPFHLLARLEGGELALRQTVRSCLKSLVAYAESVREALPPAGPDQDPGWPE